MATFDAIILADAAPYPGPVAGLSLVERARRVVTRLGAQRVLVVDGVAVRGALRSFWAARERAERLLLLRAGDQLVHVPLVQPLLAAATPTYAVAPATAVAPDVAPGDYAGALLVDGDDAARVIDLLSRGAPDAAIAATLRDAGAIATPHGEIARHPVHDAASRAAAQRLLYRILVKPQDNVITRALYRPVSLPLTRLLVQTPITPNQVSYLVALLVGVGIWMMAHASFGWAIAGTATILGASYLDCCDGEIARVKLLSSKFGAWLDTIVDELSTVGYMVATGWHCHLQFGRHYLDRVGWPGGAVDPWLLVTAVATVAYVGTIYFVYFNIIVLVGSANSQDYVGRFDVVPGVEPGTVHLRPAAATAAIYSKRELPPLLKWLATYLPYVVRRDFIAWMALVLAVTHLTHFSFATQALGGIVAVTICALDHVRVRAQLRRIRRDGLRLVRG